MLSEHPLPVPGSPVQTLPATTNPAEPSQGVTRLCRLLHRKSFPFLTGKCRWLSQGNETPTGCRVGKEAAHHQLCYLLLSLARLAEPVAPAVMTEPTWEGHSACRGHVNSPEEFPHTNNRGKSEVVNVDVRFLQPRSKTCLMVETLQAGFLILYRASHFLILLLQL